jgi:molybdopterin-biosynthesis enzyme MoeA-like protein
LQSLHDTTTTTLWRRARHSDFERRLRELFGPSLTAAHLKMAEVPAGAGQLIEYTLDSGEASKFPILKCGANIFVLPGALAGDRA